MLKIHILLQVNFILFYYAGIIKSVFSKMPIPIINYEAYDVVKILDSIIIFFNN